MARHKPIDGQISLFPQEVIQPSATQLDSPTSKPIEQPDLNFTPITKPGDIWQIGKHRLMCGDSSDWNSVNQLLEKCKVHLVHTDPPYNVSVQPQSKDKTTAKARKLQGDFISDAKFNTLLYLWFHNISRSLMPGRSYYIWGGYSNVVNYPPNIRSTGLFFSHIIIWVKSMSVFTRKDFMGKYELAFYGWKEGAPHKWFGPNNVTDVWEIANIPRKSMVHLTEKPVDIPLLAIKCSSEPGERVLDIFGGSGSTLIAADQLDRQCYLMEIDPHYCDVILERCKGLGVTIKRVNST